jgi:hypothetical protein
MTHQFQFERSVKRRDGQNLKLLEQSGSAVAHDLFKVATELARSIATGGNEGGATHKGANHFEISSLGLIQRLSTWRKRSHFTVWSQEAWS